MNTANIVFISEFNFNIAHPIIVIKGLPERWILKYVGGKHQRDIKPLRLYILLIILLPCKSIL